MYTKLLIHYFLSPVISALPLTSIAFVIALIFFKLFQRVRANFDYSANCWFCNQNTKIPYDHRNSWNCPKCEQYNGFTKDGDYNKEIYEQLDCSNVSRKSVNSSALLETSNGLCAVCNENQRIKVEKIAQFEPRRESRFDEELKVFK
ncbi:TMEM201 family protein [Megaselia abdita]